MVSSCSLNLYICTLRRSCCPRPNERVFNRIAWGIWERIPWSRGTWRLASDFHLRSQKAGGRVADCSWINGRDFSAPQRLLDQRKPSWDYLRSMPRGPRGGPQCEKCGVNCQTPRCWRRRCKPWTRREMYLLSWRKCRWEHPHDGRSLKNPTQGESQLWKLAKYKPTYSDTRQVSTFLSFLLLLPTILSLFNTGPLTLKVSEATVSHMEEKEKSGEEEKKRWSQSYPFRTLGILPATGCSCATPSQGRCLLLDQGWHF